MRPEDVDYIKHRLIRSQQVLDEAVCLFRGGFTVGVVNRIYYACFYAVSALLLLEEHASSKHSGIVSLFDRLWIKPERLPKDMGAFYHLMFEQRQKGDYEDLFAFEQADLQAWLAEAKLFLEQILAWLRDNEGLTLS